MTKEDLYDKCLVKQEPLAKLFARGIITTKEQSQILYDIYLAIPEAERNAQVGREAELILIYMDAYLGMYKKAQPVPVAHTVEELKDRLFEAYRYFSSSEFTSKLERHGIISAQERFQIIGCILMFTQFEGSYISYTIDKLDNVVSAWLDKKQRDKVNLWVWLLTNFLDGNVLKRVLLDT